MPTITSLATASSVTQDDLVLIVNDPNGTPTTQKARISDIVALASTVLAGAAWSGTYSSGTTYAAGAVVSSSGSTYVSLQAANTANTPSSSPTWWQLLNAKGDPGPDGPIGDPGPEGDPGLPSMWSTSVWAAGTYAKGVAVMHSDGNTYVAVVDSATQDPSTNHGTGDNWRQISSRGATGVKPFTTPTVWVTATAYTAGDSTTSASAVFIGGASYVCTVSHTSAAAFATDAAKWQQIAGTGGVTSISVTAPIAINNTVPAIPVVSVSKDVASGVPVLDSNAEVRRIQIPSRLVQFTHATQNLGVTGDIGGSDGIEGGTSASNNSFATKVPIARIYVDGDPSSTGAYVYNRVDELRASLTFEMDISTSVNVALYLAWVRVSDNLRIGLHYTPHTAAVSLSEGVVVADMHTYAPAIPAQNNESYRLYAWVQNSGGFIYNASGSSTSGYYDTVSAFSHPV